jgi:uncharacterized membrane protein
LLEKIGFIIHNMSALVFLPLIFFPFVVSKWKKQGAVGKGRGWTILFQLAHVFLVLSLITGFILTYNFLSSWFWVVILVFLALGAMLGITAKNFRLAKEATANDQSSEAIMAKLQRFSTILSLVVILMIILMVVRW